MTCSWCIVTCEFQEVKEKKVQIIIFTKRQSTSDFCIINLTKQLGHIGKFLIFSRGIWFLKQITFHLEDILSVSTSSRTFYWPIYSIAFWCFKERNCEITWKLIFRTRQVHSLFLQKQQKVTPFYALWSVTKIIEVGNFVFLASNPSIRCSWWVHECFIDKFQGIQQKTFSKICGIYQHDIILLLTTIF